MSFVRLLILLSLFSVATAVANPIDPFQERCPCGPDSVKGPLRLFFVQGHRGADFRPACVKHDLCYDTVGRLQEDCDAIFLDDLLAACENSRNPQKARRKARFFHWLVSKLGHGPYRSAQRIAAEKALAMQK